MGKRTGLVLEGGGLRAIYNAGVLDGLQEFGLSFDYVIGSSAGAANASSFLAGQPGRNKRISLGPLISKRFMSWGHVLKGNPYMDLDFLFKDVAYKIDPLDIKAMMDNPAEFEVAATDILSGHSVYFDKTEKDFITVMKASCALPMMFQDPISYKRYRLLDGGIGDPIPVKRAVERGCNKVVVVLTQHKGFRKTPSLSAYLLKLRFLGYAKFTKLVMTRHEMYNATLDYIKHPPKGVDMFPIFPSRPLKVARLEKDRAKLETVWSLGYRDTKRLEARLFKFLDRTSM